MTESEDVPVGQITIKYYLEGETSKPTISFEFPDLDELSLPLQLGLLDMARDSLYRIAMVDE